MKKIIFLVLRLMLLSGYTLSQSVGKIGGVVRDKSTNEGVPFANVVLFKDSANMEFKATDFEGKFEFINVLPGKYEVKCNLVGYNNFVAKNIIVINGSTIKIEIPLNQHTTEMQTVDVVIKQKPLINQDNTTSGSTLMSAKEIKALPTRDVATMANIGAGTVYSSDGINVRGQRESGSVVYINGVKVVGAISQPNQTYEFLDESYCASKENEFLKVIEQPLSTFSVDVDNASYTNIRRIINNGNLPPKDAVRIEEFINYFDYEYETPNGEHPFSINTETGIAPWNPKHKLVHIGLQGKKVPFGEIEPLNLVFLIDVSGSMNSSEKLPLLKKSFSMLVNQLREEDKVAIVVYAGAAGVVLSSTSGNEKQKILNAINNLEAGGSTAGGAGLNMAYKIALENYSEKFINRVILATDGDFNVGVSSDDEMKKIIEKNRELGISISVLGFGMGNYKDSKMEVIADYGNGNYFYIDNIQESNKVLVDELGSTLYTIAKDVKLQVEFNPAKVQAYRLIGYENRMLNKEDFNDDKKDAGDIGAGHTVTAIYEIIPVGVESSYIKKVDSLKYQKLIKSEEIVYSEELLTVKFRYKEPDGASSKLIVHSLKDSKASTHSNNFNFSAAVAGFGMLLRDSEYKQNLSFDDVITLANNSKGLDLEGYRAEFVKLVKTAKSLGGLAVK